MNVADARARDAAKQTRALVTVAYARAFVVALGLD
jgi:hypothetical protein